MQDFIDVWESQYKDKLESVWDARSLNWTPLCDRIKQLQADRASVNKCVVKTLVEEFNERFPTLKFTLQCGRHDVSNSIGKSQDLC